MIVDTSRRLQSVYVPVGDGVRLAVDVWLPVERTAVGGAVGTVMRVTRYHRAEALQEPGLEADSNGAAGGLFNGAGFALVVVDARGTGASFGTRTGELDVASRSARGRSGQTDRVTSRGTAAFALPRLRVGP